MAQGSAVHVKFVLKIASRKPFPARRTQGGPAHSQGGAPRLKVTLPKMSQPKSAHRSDSLCARDPGLGLRSPRKLRSEMLPGSHKTKKIRKPRVLPLAMDFARGSYHLKDTVQISNPICVLRIEMQIAPSPGNMPKNRKPRYLQLRMPIQRDN